LACELMGKVKHVEPDGHRPFIKGGNLRPGVISRRCPEPPNSDLTPRKHAANISGLQMSACKTKTVEPQATQFFESPLWRDPLSDSSDGNFAPDSASFSAITAANSPRATGHQCIFPP